MEKINSSYESIYVSETDEKSPLNSASFLSKRKFSSLFKQGVNDYFNEHLDVLDDEINDEMSLKLLYKVSKACISENSTQFKILIFK